MTEMTKTMAFIGTAVVVLVVAWFSRPAPATFDSTQLQGTELYEFDPLDARRMRVVSYNALSGEPREFEVAQVGNTWSIPSKNNYPADAEDQMAEAAAAVNGKEILRVASEDARDHQLYGVLDPSQDRNVGEEGVGTRVTILDQTGESLADLIIGKAEDEDTPAKRYIRRAGQDIVLVAEIDPEKFPTDFSNWIEKDLLKLSPWDIEKVQFKDYTLEFAMEGFQLRPVWTRNADLTVTYDDSDSKWIADSLLTFDPATQQYVERPLAENEELNTETLNDLKNALDDLRIVDVAKKPDQLSANLQASEDFLQESTREAVMSLIDHGFAPIGTDEDTVEILSTEGEVIVTMKTGVEYVLRFGEVAVDADSVNQANSPSGGDGAAGAEAEGGDLNRYIFVVARFNEDAIEKPEFETPPDLPEGADEATASAEDDEDAAGDETAEDSADSDAADAEAEESDEADETDNVDADADEDADAADDEQSETERILAERKRIEEDNQRKRDDYESKITSGKETVQELNERFGDWYYVVDNAEYQRIHLGLDQVVQEKEAEDEAADDGSDADATAIDAGGFGLPGGEIPGLPNIPGILDDAESESTEAEEPSADVESNATEPAPVE